MTPKEKAKELVNKFSLVGLQQREEGKECALIACDEILNEDYIIHSVHSHLSRNEFWQEVKQEITKL
ncbi:MAG TPA: hypothetical protein VFM70_02630 [Salinimicrobium sp.]|nr:hypothetical protein [Salinimicrobium sp.]